MGVAAHKPAIYRQGASSRPCIRTPSTITAISGASISLPILGTGSRRRSVLLRDPDTGEEECDYGDSALAYVGPRLLAHRMAMWKHYIVLFGGFYDPGIKSRHIFISLERFDR